MSNKKIKTCISLFTGAGGFDLGLEAAGYEIKLCLENNDSAIKTIKHNKPEWKLAEPNDVLLISPEKISKQSGIKPKKLSLLIGGPPCQPFSKSSYWAGDTARLKDPRAKTLEAYFKIVEYMLPEVFILENVKGLIFNKKDEALAFIEKEIKRINRVKKVKYQIKIACINCADYGTPQIRERIFLIAHREGLMFETPSPTHGKGLKPYTTVWDAIGDLDTYNWPEELNLTGKWADLLPSIPEGYNYLWHTERGEGTELFGWRTRFWSFLLKLAKDKPSWTIQASPGPATGPFHWKSRRLSARELCRLQTFPDDYEIIGDIKTAQKQIGNAVPPAIGELFGREILKQFYSGPQTYKLKLIPKKKKNIPLPEAVTEVNSKYLHLEGRYNPHPGVGKGPGVQKNKTIEQSIK